MSRSTAGGGLRPSQARRGRPDRGRPASPSAAAGGGRRERGVRRSLRWSACAYLEIPAGDAEGISREIGSPRAPLAVENSVWNVSDEALIAGFTTGDSDVAQVFVGRFQDRVYGLALAITRDRMAAQEVAQDAFLRAWRYGASYDPRRGSVTAWLLRITRNAALDHVRLSQRRLDHLEIDPAGAIDDMAGDADVASPLGDLAAIADGLRTLPTEQRETL